MENSSDLFKYKMSGTTIFVMALLVLVLVGLGERVLYDLSRTFAGAQFNYFNDLSTLIVHTIFVIILIAVAVLVNVAVAEKRQKYAIILIPYFILSLALTLQVSLEAAVYFYDHHTQLQFYLVMSALVIVCSMLIYVVQRNYVPLEVAKSGGRSLWVTVVFWIAIVLFLGVPLLHLLFVFFGRGGLF